MGIKKSFLTPLICMVFAIPSFADIAPNADSATCNSTTLTTASGSASLTAQWAPNTINITWDDNDATTAHSGGASSCSYSDTFAPPTTPPQRTGYTFGGWTLKLSQCSLIDLNPATAGTGNDNDGMKWQTVFDYGTIYGDALCSSDSSTYGQSGTPVDDSGQYCWCKATKYQPKTGNLCAVSNSNWIYRDDRGSSAYCAMNCAYNCAFALQSYSSFRRPMFGIQ